MHFPHKIRNQQFSKQNHHALKRRDTQKRSFRLLRGSSPRDTRGEGISTHQEEGIKKTEPHSLTFTFHEELLSMGAHQRLG